MIYTQIGLLIGMVLGLIALYYWDDKIFRFLDRIDDIIFRRRK